MPYEVRLECFEGPLDLLLHLITKQRVDIYEVSIATITDEYLAAVEGVGRFDLEAATGFLVIAATLLELKSARLLPRSSEDDVDAGLLEERDLLLARLVESATFRAAGEWLAAALEEGRGFMPRTAGLERPYADLAPDLLGRIGVDDVARAAAAVLAPRPAPVVDTAHVSSRGASVSDALVVVAERIKSNSSVSFRTVCADAVDRLDVVVRFLAVLELFKAGAVGMEQAERFGDIRAWWTGDVESLDDLDVGDYAVAAEVVP